MVSSNGFLHRVPSGQPKFKHRIFFGFPVDRITGKCCSQPVKSVFRESYINYHGNLRLWTVFYQKFSLVSNYTLKKISNCSKKYFCQIHVIIHSKSIRYSCHEKIWVILTVSHTKKGKLWKNSFQICKNNFIF
jgi:hypothetical protein